MGQRRKRSLRANYGGTGKNRPFVAENTVITLLSRLVEKGLLRTNKIGRRNEYTAIVSEEDYQAAQTRTFLNKLYEGSAKGLVATLIQKEMLSAEDYEELRRFWESGGEAE